MSRPTAKRWTRGFRAEPAAGRPDRSSQPKWTPTRTSAKGEHVVLDARGSSQFGPLRIATRTGGPPRSVSRILQRHGDSWHEDPAARGSRTGLR